jgi:hypothetical protein
MKKYTVLGYWDEAGDPWLEFGEGYTPEQGMIDAIESAMREHDWDLDFMKGLTILEVVEGHHPGLLGNSLLFTAYEALTKETRP